MNILICDDICDEAAKLEKIIKESGFEANYIFFDNGADALAYIKSGIKVNVCFLDIIMPGMKGTELASLLRKANYSGEIVFLSTSNDYAAEAFEVGAFFYLVKPPNAQKVAKVLNDIAESKKSADTAGIPISTSKITEFLRFREISFIEVINNKVYFRLLDGREIVLYCTLNEVLPQLLADERFAQCHRSYVVNMDAITQIHGKEIIFKCGRKAPVSRSYKEFNDFYLRRGMGSDM